eukprot:scaffold227089_cov16-Tisochrysis_lutea.AAC.1
MLLALTQRSPSAHPRPKPYGSRKRCNKEDCIGALAAPGDHVDPQTAWVWIFCTSLQVLERLAHRNAKMWVIGRHVSHVRAQNVSMPLVHTAR